MKIYFGIPENGISLSLMGLEISNFEDIELHTKDIFL
jgi:hypothetical protein